MSGEQQEEYFSAHWPWPQRRESASGSYISLHNKPCMRIDFAVASSPHSFSSARTAAAPAALLSPQGTPFAIAACSTRGAFIQKQD